MVVHAVVSKAACPSRDRSSILQSSAISCHGSSEGQSARLISERSPVRCRPVAPIYGLSNRGEIPKPRAQADKLQTPGRNPSGRGRVDCKMDRLVARGALRETTCAQFMPLMPRQRGARLVSGNRSSASLGGG